MPLGFTHRFELFRWVRYEDAQHRLRITSDPVIRGLHEGNGLWSLGVDNLVVVKSAREAFRVDEHVEGRD